MRRSPLPPLVVILATFWLLSGCGPSSHRSAGNVFAPDPPAAVAAGDGWWRIRFKMARTGDVTHWERDLLIAHRILAPVISRHRDDLGLWRFHRRSAEDDLGHQFSFLFFTSAPTAGTINRQVVDDPLIAQLLAESMLVGVLTDAVDQNARPAVSDTSDPHWSPIMQRTWPYYIMGVSRMWLAMIDELSRAVGTAADADSERLLDHYRTVNRQLTGMWQQEGQHALLHHLNAIFGYEPMMLRETRWQAF